MRTVPRWVVAILIGVSFLGDPVFAQNAPHRVGVLPFQNRTGDERYLGVCRSMTDTIDLTVRLLPDLDYAAVSLRDTNADESGPVTPAQIVAVAAPPGATRVITGAVYRSPDTGEIEARLVAYDGTDGTVLFEETREIALLLDTFAVTDELVARAFERLGSGKVAWGAIHVESDIPFTPRFSILVDDETGATGTTTIDRVVTGTRRVRILQERPLGTFTLADTSAEITADQTTTISVSVPSVTDEERSALDSMENEIRRLMSEDPKNAESVIRMATVLLEDRRDTDGLQDYYATFTRLEGALEGAVAGERLWDDHVATSAGFAVAVPLGTFHDEMAIGYQPTLSGDYTFVRRRGEVACGLIVSGLVQPSVDTTAYDATLLSAPVMAHVLYRTHRYVAPFVYADLGAGVAISTIHYGGSDTTSGATTAARPTGYLALGAGYFITPRFGITGVVGVQATGMSDGVLYNVVPGIRTEYNF